MGRRSALGLASSFLLLLTLAGCVQDHPRPLGVIESNLNAEQRRARLTIIRDTAAARGITNGVLLAGIAQNETGLAHCWSEATWACQGPDSADCGGGPVIAGAGDGPCADRQGGLGMFQFDAGTYDDTLRREGDRILSVQGNVDAAIDFVIAMVIRSVYIDGVDTAEQAIAWMNSVEVRGARQDEWIKTVTHYYNGCTPTGCSVYASRYANYTRGLETVWDEMGAEFWLGAMAPSCEPVPPEGRILDDRDPCVSLGGDLRYWRTATDAGYGGSLRWTRSIAADSPSNYGIWHLRFVEGGEHELFVTTPLAYAESRMAPYRVTHAGGETRLSIDQTTSESHSLGTFSFIADTDYEVELGDNSGEPSSDAKTIVLDALEVVPVGPPAEPDAGAGSPDAGTIAPEPDAGGGADAGTWSRPTASEGCSCRVAGTGGAPARLAPSLVLLALLGVLCARRRRAR